MLAVEQTSPEPDDPFNFLPVTVASMPADSGLPGGLYEEFQRVRKKQELAGKPIPEMTEVCRRMTPQQRWRTAERMSADARREILKNVGEEFPDWPVAQLNAEVNRRFATMCE